MSQEQNINRKGHFKEQEGGKNNKDDSSIEYECVHVCVGEVLKSEIKIL